MVRRLAVAAAAAAMVLGLVAPTPATAAVDPVFGWNYQTVAIGGTYTMLRGQFAGDGATDLLFYAPGAAADSLWIGKTGTQGASGFTKVPLSIGGTYVPVVGDFGGDDYSDILWYGRGSKPDALWISTDTSSYFTGKSISISGANYEPKVLQDYRGVGAKDDVVFLGPGTVPDYLWHFDEQLGADVSTPGTWVSRTLHVNGSYQLIVGDWDGDLLDDLVLYQPGTAHDYKWISSASGAFTQTNLSISGVYQPATVRHEQYDGIYWWASGSPKESYWNSNGTSFVSKPVVQYPTLKGRAVTYGGDGVLIQSDNERDGYVAAEATKADTYLLSNANHDFGTGTQVAVGDFDLDGGFDTIWYTPGAGRDEVWYGPKPDPKAKSARPHGTQLQKDTPFTER